MRRGWAAAAAAAILYFLIGYGIHGTSGLQLVSATPTSDTRDVQIVETIQPPPPPFGGGTAIWSGGWDVTGGPYDLVLDSSGTCSWTIDDLEIVKTSGARTPRTVWLDRGVHAIG